jgi:hypothetical protein
MNDREPAGPGIGCINHGASVSGSRGHRLFDQDVLSRAQ